MKSQLVAVAGVALWSTLAIAQSAPPVADTFADTTAVTQNYGTNSLLAVTTKNTAYLEPGLRRLEHLGHQRTGWNRNSDSGR